MKEPVELEVPVPVKVPEDVVAAVVEETPEEPAKVEEEEEIPRRGGRTPYTPKPRSKRGQQDKQEDKEVGYCFVFFRDLH